LRAVLDHALLIELVPRIPASDVLRMQHVCIPNFLSRSLVRRDRCHGLAAVLGAVSVDKETIDSNEPAEEGFEEHLKGFE